MHHTDLLNPQATVAQISDKLIALHPGKQVIQVAVVTHEQFELFHEIDTLNSIVLAVREDNDTVLAIRIL
jgi:hypothetical protein